MPLLQRVSSSRLPSLKHQQFPQTAQSQTTLYPEQIPTLTSCDTNASRTSFQYTPVRAKTYMHNCLLFDIQKARLSSDLPRFHRSGRARPLHQPSTHRPRWRRGQPQTRPRQCQFQSLLGRNARLATRTVAPLSRCRRSARIPITTSRTALLVARPVRAQHRSVGVARGRGTSGSASRSGSGGLAALQRPRGGQAG